MTNFEKWVASLTPELVANVINAVTDAEICELCPFDGICSTACNGCLDSLLAYFAEEDAPKRGTVCEHIADCPWGVYGWCNRPYEIECTFVDKEAKNGNAEEVAE